MGKEPTRLPDDHPYAWQWEYQGSPGERKELARRLGLNDDEEEVVIDGQGELFG